MIPNLSPLALIREPLPLSRAYSILTPTIFHMAAAPTNAPPTGAHKGH